MGLLCVCGVCLFLLGKGVGLLCVCVCFFTGERGRASKCMVVASMVRNSNIANGS